MDKIPDELVCNILHLLDVTREPGLHNDLLAVGGVSRRLNCIVTPLLYAHCAIVRGGNGVSTTSDRAYRLLDSIVLKPELGYLVRRLSVYFAVDPAPARLPPSDVCLGAIDALTELPILHDVMCAVRKRSYQGAVTLLLCQMPNLRHFDLDIQARNDEDETNLDCSLVMRLFELAVVRPVIRGYRVLANLAHVRISSDIGERVLLHSRWLSIFLRLPSLRHLQCTGLDSSARVTDWACDEGRSNIDTLELYNCGFNDEDLLLPLGACKTLSEFSFNQHCVSMDGCSFFPKTKYSLLVSALVCQRGAMKHLRLDSAICGHSWTHVTAPHLRSLRDLSNLEHLDLATSMLFKNNQKAEHIALRELLPGSLTSLTLRFPRSDGSSGDTTVAQMLQQIAELFSSRALLQKVDVFTGSPMTEFNALQPLLTCQQELEVVQSYEEAISHVFAWDHGNRTKTRIDWTSTRIRIERKAV